MFLGAFNNYFIMHTFYETSDIIGSPKALFIFISFSLNSIAFSKSKSSANLFMVTSVSIAIFTRSALAMDFVSIARSMSAILSGMGLTTDLGVIWFFILYWICFLRLLSVSIVAFLIDSVI